MNEYVNGGVTRPFGGGVCEPHRSPALTNAARETNGPGAESGTASAGGQCVTHLPGHS